MDNYADDLCSGIFYKSESYDAYENLAAEACLLKLCEAQRLPILYLWQNKSCVVIGRNQNAYTECNIDYANDNGIQIARRTTGGGAVYHDLGNINFTIILPKEIYAPDCSTQVIINALKSLGLNAEKTGRNDICIDGKKISGNAFYSNENVGMHHGTVLHKINISTMEKVLKVSEAKLSKHGIPSVRARVGDIISIRPDIMIDDVTDAIKTAFFEKYEITSISDACINEANYEKELLRFRSADWNFNKISEYEQLTERQFDWGNVRISFLFDGTKLQGIEIASDTLYVEQIDNLRIILNRALSVDGEINADLHTELYRLCKQEIADDILSIIKEVCP